MKKLIAVLLALSCMLIGAAAVAETLNIAYMPNYGSLWSVETAINKGYFEEEGLTINLVEFADGPTIIAAMESGSIDMGYIGQGAHKLCINGRASIFALSHISNGDALIGGKGIATVEDLKGKVGLLLRHVLRGHPQELPRQGRHDHGRHQGDGHGRFRHRDRDALRRRGRLRDLEPEQPQDP